MKPLLLESTWADNLRDTWAIDKVTTNSGFALDEERGFVSKLKMVEQPLALNMGRQTPYHCTATTPKRKT